MNASHSSEGSHERLAVLRSLMRGELAAREVYYFVIGHGDVDASLASLRDIAFEHTDSAKLLAAEIYRLGGPAPENSGFWGALIKGIGGAVVLVGEGAMLSLLERGERFGLECYEHALNNPSLPLSPQTLIRDRLIPRQEAHLELLAEVLSLRSR